MRTTRLAVALLASVALLSGAASAEEPSPFAGQSGDPRPTPPPTAAVDNAASATGVDPGGTQSGGGSNGGRPDPYEYRTRVLQGPCPPTPLDPTPQLVQRERRLRSGGPWEPTGPAGCTGQPTAPQPVVDLTDIRNTAVTVRAQVSPPRPSLTVQPQAGSLVNQPAVFAVGEPGAPPVDTALNPLSQRTVTVRLSSPTYSWEFGDGVGRAVGSSRGQTYVRGDSVPREGAGDPYVSHTYAAPGEVTVSVTATYAVTYTFSGDPRVFTLPPLQVTESEDLRVRPARSELVES